ncbi:MAG: single-stranded-DNA-specific exonuclease RecJ [Lachnospiraceae bacterium]|nr:single-stranded-DNA-specific exonuclease RecJ [Lachnospiraceae bacterium]
MEKWFVAAQKADFQKWAADFSISPVLARILRNRDLTENTEIEKFLYGKLEDCYAPGLMKDMEKAAGITLQAILEKKAIRVIGDYDVDGICSAYILTKGLKTLGANVSTAIPHRIHDGYGLNDHLIELAKADGVELIITCDNGIAAAPQIALANANGIGVIVTDHHEVPFVEEEGVRREILPAALAVVDPKQESCGYPFKSICGGVVAYKLVQALFEKADALQDEKLRPAEVLEELLEFAALATVCDVMELKDENRIIVKEGLKRLKNTRNQGLRALMEVNSIEPGKLSAYHLGFVLGPCLNATGRLDTAKRALELLQSESKVDAMSAARELKDLNDSRKNMTLQGVKEAEAYIAAHHLEQDPVMLVYLPHVHESLAGIIAGRIREKYNHPVFVLTKSEEGVKGSGRSIESYHMYEAMTRVKHFFTKYGGHKLAAGLSMEEKDIEALRRAMNADSGLTAEDFIPRVHIDVPMPLSYADEDLAAELDLLEPFGVGNPKPLFAQKNLTFRAGFKMGVNKNFARFRVSTPEGMDAQVVFFGDLERFGAFLDEKYGSGSAQALYAGRGDFSISVVYQLSLNTYRGRTEVQFVMQHYC